MLQNGTTLVLYYILYPALIDLAPKHSTFKNKSLTTVLLSSTVQSIYPALVDFHDVTDDSTALMLRFVGNQ